MSHTGYASNAQSRGSKLGYYRASVACSYCRKRKARCIPSANYEGRCASCARLGLPCVAVAVAHMRALDDPGSSASLAGRHTMPKDPISQTMEERTHGSGTTGPQPLESWSPSGGSSSFPSSHQWPPQTWSQSFQPAPHHLTASLEEAQISDPIITELSRTCVDPFRTEAWSNSMVENPPFYQSVPPSFDSFSAYLNCENSYEMIPHGFPDPGSTIGPQFLPQPATSPSMYGTTFEPALYGQFDSMCEGIPSLDAPSGSFLQQGYDHQAPGGGSIYGFYGV